MGRNLVATFVHLRHPKQLLIIPLSMYVGIVGAALSAEFSQVTNSSVKWHRTTYELYESWCTES